MEKKKSTGVGRWSALTAVFALLLVAVIIGNSVAQTYATVINIYLGTETYKLVKSGNGEDTNYFESEFATEAELIAYEEALCEQVESEGATLLLNRNNALPLKKGDKVSAFSHSSVDLMYGGTGSGKVDTSTAPTFKDALDLAGLNANETLWSFYTSKPIFEAYKRATPAGWDDMDIYLRATPKFGANEVPWDKVTAAAGDSFAAYGDAAIMVLSRSGGEGSDLPSGDNGSGLTYINGVDGNYLALSPEEKDSLAGLKALKDDGTFRKIIVLLNSSNAIELDFLSPAICGTDYGIDACMWIGDVGQTGINAVGKLLTGEITPSGRLADTYCYDNLTSPSIRNFYALQYTNAEEKGLSYGDALTDYGTTAYNYNVTNSYNVYQEGIYIGYRYYETRYEDLVMGSGNAGNYPYATTVAYPFGYGTSYTSFAYSDFTVTPADDQFAITVKVTNTGATYSGKETVQIYFQSPYTDYDKANGIEKSAVELCGFGKTGVLAPGASETLKIEVKKEELRAFDANGAGTYILDAGDYYFTAATDAHNAVNNILAAKGFIGGKMDAAGDSALTYQWNNPALDSSIFAKSSATGQEIISLFDQADPNRSSISPGKVTYLSRSDWEGTFPKENIVFAATDEMVAALAHSTYNPADHAGAVMPTMGEKGDATLASMIGKSFDDPAWEPLLDQITFEEMAKTITLGYHNTAAVPSIGKAATKDENGPTGLTASLTGGTSAMCYTSEDVMAATFNTELISQVGKCIGEDCLAAGYSGLYGPGANIHRSPYSGRNFEYYSEDPFLSGAICAAEVEGIQEKGVYVYLKHFALNDSESYRMGVCTWTNEQAARELYIEPFARAIEDGGAWCVMNAFPRWGCTWAGADKNLQTNVLRGELGMRGINITDYSGDGVYMDVADGLLAGSDLWDSSSEYIHTVDIRTYKNDPVIVSAMRNAMHRILFTVVNSNAMNGIAASDKVVHMTPWWQVALIATIVLFAVATLGSGVMLYRSISRRNKQRAATRTKQQ